ncbi:MAG: trypsin-like peptidase domain-containing protein [Armatimonadetes bacterium]|nr:trypsin-like peptidase domain-containing protein [Armatimonadota bacterium]
MSCAAFLILSSVLSPWNLPDLNQDPVRHDAAAIYRNSIESVVWVTNEGRGFSAIGTGFVVFDSSTIATAWHVIKDAEKLTVRFSAGTEVKVDGVLGVDRAADLALLKIRKTSRRPLAIREDDPEIGEQVFAIGNPRGLDFSIADGIISQIREMHGKKHYQHSIPTTQGNSGGPILDVQGRVIGIQRSGIRGESALKFASAASGLNDFDRSVSPAPMPGELSGTVAWRFERKVAGHALIGSDEVLLVAGPRFMTLDLQSGGIKTDVQTPTAYMPGGLVSNKDGSTVVILHGAFRMAILHRHGGMDYTKREDASGLWNGPLITDDGTIFNIGGTLGENQSISDMQLEASYATSDELIWSAPGVVNIVNATGFGRRLMLVRSKYLVLYDESFDDELVVYDADTGDFLWKSEMLADPAGSPLGLIYYNTSHRGMAAAYDLVNGRAFPLPPLYLHAASARTGEIVYSLKGEFGTISVGPDGTVYVSDDGDLIAMNAELTEVKWRARLGSRVFGRAAFDSEGSLFVPVKDGRLVAIDAGSGRVRWSYSGGEEYYFNGQVSVEDGLVVAETRNGTLIAIRD